MKSSLAPCLFLSLLLPGSRAPQDDLAYEVIDVGEHVYVLEPIGKSSHRLSVAVDGDEAFLVDASFAKNSGAILNALEEVGVKRIRYLVNTHFHSDHVDGNRVLGDGATIIAHARTRESLLERRAPAPETVLPAAALPALTIEDSLTIHFAEQAIELTAFPLAHTDSDVVVYFEKAKLLHLGDIMLAEGSLPYTAKPQALLDCLETLLGTLPADTKIVPGHGPLTDLDGLCALRDIVKATRDYVRDGRAEGKSPAELVAGADPAWTEWSGKYLTIEDWIRELCSRSDS